MRSSSAAFWYLCFFNRKRAREAAALFWGGQAELYDYEIHKGRKGRRRGEARLAFGFLLCSFGRHTAPAGGVAGYAFFACISHRKNYISRRGAFRPPEGVYNQTEIIPFAWPEDRSAGAFSQCFLSRLPLRAAAYLRLQKPESIPENLSPAAAKPPFCPSGSGNGREAGGPCEEIRKSCGGLRPLLQSENAKKRIYSMNR